MGRKETRCQHNFDNSVAFWLDIHADKYRMSQKSTLSVVSVDNSYGTPCTIASSGWKWKLAATLQFWQMCWWVKSCLGFSKHSGHATNLIECWSAASNFKLLLPCGVFQNTGDISKDNFRPIHTSILKGDIFTWKIQLFTSGFLRLLFFKQCDIFKNKSANKGDLRYYWIKLKTATLFF